MNYLVGIVLTLTLLQSVVCQCDSNPCDYDCSGCRDYFDPVCASNDRDFRNMCELYRESLRRQCRGESAIVLAYGGPCKCDCSKCPTKYDPVCGSDGRSYWNDCWRRCYDACNQRRDQPRVSKVGDGYCCN